MTLVVEMLPAGHGDALIVEYGGRGTKHQVLIDAGTFSSWDGVRSGLLRRHQDRYETFVVTHVDEDHIGGAIALLDDPDLKHRVNNVWFNGFIHCERGGNVLGPINGEQLTTRIVEGGFAWNHGFPRRVSNDIGGPIVVSRSGKLPRMKLPGGACAVLLSPTAPKLKRMAAVWKAKVEEAGLVPGAESHGHTKAPRPRDRTADPLPQPLDADAIDLLAADTRVDGSEANGSSIAFVLEYGGLRGKRVLLAGDAHASVLTSALRRYAEMVGEDKVRLDLVKLSHHGSNANVSTKMLDMIDCHRFLVSTNGDNFAHPDDAALAKIIRAASGPVTFFCNYRSKRTEPWSVEGPAVGATFEFPKSSSSSLRVEA